MSDTTMRASLHFSARGLLLLAVACAGFFVAATDGADESTIDVFTLVMRLFGGLALFLFGIDQMSDGLKSVAGKRMSTLLGGITRNRFLGSLTGAFVTAILNSSSVTTVLVVGFITAGIMTLQQSIGVIMGANIGSTMTAQIVAFNVTQYAMLPIAIGFGMIFFAKSEKMKQGGSMLFGLGLLFGGMGIMSDAMYPLRSFQPFLDLMAHMNNPVLGILVGMVFTSLVQSSAATTGIAIVMAAEGLLSLPAGIALALGANIGTCVTAILASLGKPVAARRAAMAHVLFNVLGVLIWLPLIGVLANLATAISPAHPELAGAARMAEEVPRQIANAHTIFNVANTFLFIWFTGTFAKVVEKLVPDRPEKVTEIIKPEFLDEALLDTPSIALRAARFEGARLGKLASDVVKGVGPALRNRDSEALAAVEKLDDQLDVLKEKIMDYLERIYKKELTGEETEELLRLMRGTDEIERIGNVVRDNVIPIGLQFIEGGLEVSETTKHTLDALYDEVCRSVTLAVDAISDVDEAKALEIIQMKGQVNTLVSQALSFQAERVAPTEPNLITMFRMEDEVIDALKRIYNQTKRIAKLLLPQAVLEREA